MGKKTKKRTGGAIAKGKGAPKSIQQAGSQQKPKDPKLSSDQKSLYAIYKYSTEAVIEWGRSAYRKKRTGSKLKASSFSLSQALFDCLGSLAQDGILMPAPVLKDLQTAIAYRKRVGSYYRAVPSASEEDHAKHEWLISKLEWLEGLFASNSRTADKDSENNDETTPSTTVGFAALSMSDDDSTATEAAEDDAAPRPDDRKMVQVGPTAEELLAEERLFGISLVLCEIAEVRADLKQIWKDWATKDAADASKAAQDLLAATACTQYALSAMRKLILQTSVEFQSFDDFQQILQSFGETALKDQQIPQQLDIEDCVTIRKLEKRPDLNGRHGRITGVEDGRYAVHLFPLNAYRDGYKNQVLAVKTENLILSDNPFLRLSQIHQALNSFNFDSVPKEPARVYLSPASQHVKIASDLLAVNVDKFVTAMKQRDFVAFLDLTVRFVLPLWVSLSRFLPPRGAADIVLLAYLRDFDETRKVTFHLAFALLVAIDGAFSVAELNHGDKAEGARELYVKLLQDTIKGSIYNAAIVLINQNKGKPDGFYGHYDFSRRLWGEYNAMCRFFPLASGQLLLCGFQLHLVCGSNLPFTFQEPYTVIIHLYWMLRCEGYVGRMAEIEDTLIRIYRQHVWFRGGIPQKGQEGHMKAWQLAIGATLQATKLLDGRQIERGTAMSSKVGKDGLMVTQISRLLDILQWTSMPFFPRGDCFEEIDRIAREECQSIFTVPLMEACVKISRLGDALSSHFSQRARASGECMIENYGIVTKNMEDLDRVCFWGLALADNRSIQRSEKGVGLALLAKDFQSCFREEAKSEDTASLTFSPANHIVDSGLWGQKGAFRVEQSLA